MNHPHLVCRHGLPDPGRSRRGPLACWALSLALAAAACGQADPDEPTPAGPVCGDGVVEGSEACDDDNPWGGDGCGPDCAVEDGLLEAEPNDGWEDATPWDGTALRGGLPEGDVDCHALEVPACGAVSVRVEPPGDDGTCSARALLRLHDPTGAQVAVGAVDAAGCATLDPARSPGARAMTPGTWAVCLEGQLGETVPAYDLSGEVLSTEALGLEEGVDGGDADGDGQVDRCDTDRDGDGTANADDLCPDVPDGEGAPPLTVNADGFVQHWLAVGPLTGVTSPQGCLPTDGPRVDPVDDGLAEPAVGDAVEGTVWRTLVASGDRVDLRGPFGTADAPREAVLVTWLYDADGGPVTVGLGPDDGVRAWLNGTLILEDDACQGTQRDRYLVDTTLQAGWNRLTVTVYDQGGGWGLFARLLDGDTPRTAVQVGLSPDGTLPGGDLDGDGVGDLCDPEPTAGP